jgi:trans-aconitate 2-methyltransferase
MPREWDATAYDALPLPHQQWGLRTIDRLSLVGDETVLDAGCGTGRDAEVLLQRLPGGRVIAIDGSVAMLDRLRERLAGDLDRVEIALADLTRPLPISGPVDAILSVATFHWIQDHDSLFRNLAEVLRPGGRMAIDCGGRGNIATVAAAIADVLGTHPTPWTFAGVEETRHRLAGAGFTDLDVRLVPDPARFSGTAQFQDYLRTVVIGGQLDQLPEDEHGRFVAAVADRLPEPVVDYVRLQITCRR